MSASSEFGKEHGLIHEAVVTGRKVGAGKEFWATLAHSEEVFRKVVDLVSAKPTFTVLVDYSRTLAAMIAAGRYDYVNPDITTEHFPIQGEGRRELRVALFHFNRVMSSEQVIAELDSQGFRPAKLEELLALGETRPELQKEFPIVGLGSGWPRPRDDGGRSAPFLYWGGLERSLGLRWFRDSWRALCRFAAVCK